MAANENDPRRVEGISDRRRDSTKGVSGENPTGVRVTRSSRSSRSAQIARGNRRSSTGGEGEGQASRQRTELEERRRELEFILEHAPFMVARCGRDLRYRYMSRECANLVGTTPQGVVGKKIVEVIGRKAMAAIRPYVEKVLRGHRVEFEMLIPFQNQERFIHAVYLPERNESGKVIGWVAALFDLSENRKAAESLARAVRQQTALYQFVRRRHESRSLADIYSATIEAIVTTLPCDRALILFLEESKTKVVASRRFSEGLQRKIKGCVPWSDGKRKLKPIFNEEITPASFPSRVSRAFLEEGIHAAALIPLTRDTKLVGQFIIGYDQAHPFSEEEITLALNIAGQLTLAVERKRAEAVLSESAELYRAFFSQTDVGMARSDLTGRLIAVNKKLSEITGYPESELIGKKIADLIEERYRPETGRLFRRLVKRQKAYHQEKQYRRKDGSLVWVHVTASPLRDRRGNTVAAVAVIRDISERKEAEAALENARALLEKRVEERTQELIASNQQLRAEISRRKGLEGEILEVSEREQRRIGQELHDSLCQHLTAIAYMARSMAMRLKNHRVVDVADLEKIAALINDGVTEARTIARGLHPVEMNPSGFTAALQSLLQQRSQLPYRLEIDDEVVITDPSVALHLYRIASEAVINANRHARARELVVRMRGSRREIELSITDDGIGVASPQSSGPGMGFHVMNYRARSIGARLEIASVKPCGTRVACYLSRQ